MRKSACLTLHVLACQVISQEMGESCQKNRPVSEGNCQKNERGRVF